GRMSTQFCQRYQRCSRRVCVRREQMTGKKFRPTISQKKLVAPEFVAAQQSRLKLFPRGFARGDNAREAGQDKRSMKILAPWLIIISTIGPGTGLSLASATV